MEGHKADLYLCLSAPAVSASGDAEALIAAGRPAALLITEATGAPRDAVRALIQSGKRQNLAVLIADDIELAAALGADGVHIPADQRRLAAARARLGADKTVGVSCSLSRHEAMVMGEGGADYVAFAEHWREGPRDMAALAGMVGWWAAIFELPCVAWLGEEDAAGEARMLADAGADFVAVRCGVRSPAEDIERLGGIAAGLERK